MQTLMAVVGPLLFNNIYTFTVATNPALTFYVLSGTTGLGFLVTFAIQTPRRLQIGTGRAGGGRGVIR